MADLQARDDLIMDHQTAVEILRSGDSFKLAEAIQSNGSPAEAGQTFLQLGLDLYWKSKDVRAVIVVCQLGIHFCLTFARDNNTAIETRDKLLDAAKKMAFNLASFCWAGWDEPGISIRESETEIGADAARLNLRLAVELNRPPLGMSLAHWMLGGYALAQKRFENAAEDFRKSLEFAQQADDTGQLMLNQGFLALARLGMKTPGSAEELNQIIQSLDAKDTDDTREYSRQLQAARKVFGL